MDYDQKLKNPYLFLIQIIPMTNQHVVPRGDQRAVQWAGNERATKIVDTQREAIDIARDIARNQQTELIIHRPNGQIREKDSYGRDPYPPKG